MVLSSINRVTVVTLDYPAADPIVRREHIAITEDVACALGIPVPLAGRVFQVRVAVTAPDEAAGNSANFTVVALLAGDCQVALYPSSSETANDGGVYKLFDANTLPAGARAVLYSQAPSVTTVDGAPFRASFAEPSAGRYFRESAVTGDGELLLLAPHGGNVEEETSAQLATLRSELETLGHSPAAWDAQGTWGGGQTARRWHVRSADINPWSFPGLAHLVGTFGRFPRAVALHGFVWEGESAADPDTWKYGIVIGGRAPLAEKMAVMAAIVAEAGAGRISFAIADAAGDASYPRGPNGDLAAYSRYTELRGVAAENLVNRLSPKGGIQLEQSRGVRETFASEVALGVANALDWMAGSISAAAPEPELARCCC